MAKVITKMAGYSSDVSHTDELQAALQLIRHYIARPDREYGVQCIEEECSERAQHVIKEVRDYIEMVGRQMMMNFDIGPVACVWETPSSPRLPGGGVSLYFGVHQPEPYEVKLGVKITPLYK